LLQHAHSELTHDNVYKVSRDVTVSNTVRRTVARSMALIEAVDESFERAIEQLQEATKLERDAMLNLSTIYRRHVQLAPGSDLTNSIVLQAFRDQLGDHLVGAIEEMVKSRSFVLERIRERHARLHQFRQPWILLAYHLVGTRPELVRHRWPLTDEEVQPVFTDLGSRLH
jgi:putative GTP pyrophosphokinase